MGRDSRTIILMWILKMMSRSGEIEMNDNQFFSERRYKFLCLQQAFHNTSVLTVPDLEMLWDTPPEKKNNLLTGCPKVTSIHYQ